MELSWLLIGFLILFVWGLCIAMTLFTVWNHVVFCIEFIVPDDLFVTPCQVALMHRFLIGPFVSWTIDQEILRVMFPLAEKWGMLISVDNMTGCHCVRAYKRAPRTQQTARDERTVVEPDAVPMPA